jgi:hypothetical protein
LTLAAVVTVGVGREVAHARVGVAVTVTVGTEKVVAQPKAVGAVTAPQVTVGAGKTTAA